MDETILDVARAILEVQFITDNLGKMEVNSFESIIKRWNEFFKYSIEIFEQDFFNLLYDFFLKLKKNKYFRC